MRRLATRSFAALVLAALLLPALLLPALLLSGGACAVLPGERLDDPVLEARARDISAEIRCVVCQNESIDSSGAGIAQDMRVLIRERLSAGDSDAQVKDFLVARYGDYVLLRPPFASYTLLLWLGPVLVLLLGGLGAALYLRGGRGAGAGAGPLSAEERGRLARLA
ncbi:MAG: cytochrome c-type biogenesis protein, partial [Tistlia sp.]